MHRVYLAWDTKEAKRFLSLLQGRGITGRIIEDEVVNERGGVHDPEISPEVWITDDSKLDEALALASEFETLRRPKPEPETEPDEEPGAKQP